jgi:putative methyltransferase (TIGR04325 family)
MNSALFSVWQGVYDSFKESGGDTDAFDSDIWIQKQKDRIYQALLSIEKDSFSSRDYPMSLIIAMMLSHQKTVSVLDFGGGMGVQYLDLIATIPDSKSRVKYRVVDGKTSVEMRPEVLNKFKNLYFYNDFKEIKEPIDVIHIGSTLQYIDDWRGLLTVLWNEFKPEYFIFSDLLVGDVPTFVSHQVFYKKRIPHRFINVKEFSNFIKKELKMNLLFKTKFVRSILNQEEIFPNFDLPKLYQIDRPYHMVFSSK